MGGAAMACTRQRLRMTISAALVLAPVLASPQAVHGADPVAATETSLEQAIKAFDEAAMRVNDVELERIARWTGPIRLAVADYSGMNRIAAEVESTVRELAAIARLHIVRVP